MCITHKTKPKMREEQSDKVGKVTKSDRGEPEVKKSVVERELHLNQDLEGSQRGNTT